jgi:hypothetical protein
MGDSKIPKKAAPPSQDTHEYAMGDETFNLERNPWESMTAFKARCEFFEFLAPETTEEAVAAVAKSALWYNVRYLGCGYDQALLDSVGNPETLVVVKAKEAPNQQNNAPIQGGTRDQANLFK